MSIEFTKDEIAEIQVLINMRIIDANRAAHLIPAAFDEVRRLQRISEKVGKLRETSTDRG